MNAKTLAVGAIAVLALAGCDRYEENIASIKAQVPQSEALIETLADPDDADSRDSNVRVTEGVWLGPRVVRVDSYTKLPDIVEGEFGFVLSNLSDIDFSTIAYGITEATGIRIRYAPELDGEIDVDFGDGVIYTGPLSRFLDSVASVANVEWNYDPNTNSIEFFQHVTRAFRIHAFSSSSTATGTAGSVSFSSDVELWDEIVTSVEAIIGDEGEVEEAGSSGFLIVTTTPRLMRRVGEFVEQQNVDLLRQIVVNVAIFTVSINDSQGIGVDLTGIYQRLGSRISINAPDGFGAVGGLTSSFAVLAGEAGPATSPGSYLKGSTVTLDALAKIGKVRVVTNISLPTLNDQPVPLDIGNETNFVSATTTTTTELGPVVSSTTSTLDDGLELLVQPRILPDNRIRITFSLDLSEGTLSTFTSGGGAVQLPAVAERKFLNQVVIGNGDTLVLAGYDRVKEKADDQGIAPGLWFLSGKLQGSDEREVVVITIQPIVLKDSDRVDIPASAFEG